MINFDQYRVDMAIPSRYDARLTRVECMVRDSNNPEITEFICLEIDLTGLTGNARYSAIQTELIKVRDDSADISDLKDLPVDTWYNVE